MWPSPLGIYVVSRLFCLLHRGPFRIKRLSRGGESIVEFYISSALHWESLRYYCVCQIFMRYLRNCGLEIWYCGISKHAEFLCDSLGAFQHGCVEVFDFSLRYYGVWYTPSRSSIFFCACVYFSYKIGFDSVIPCPVAILESSTLLVPNNSPMIICYAVEPINRNN